jgi:Ca2+:H+ antiporter
MTITVVVLIIPTVLHSAFASSHSGEIDSKILAFSRGAAIITLFLYVFYLYFNLRTHPHLFVDKLDDDITTANNSRTNSNLNEQDNNDDDNDNDNDNDDDNDDDNNNDDETSTLWISSITLLIATAGIVLCTHLLFHSLDSVSRSTRITKRFIAVILLPISSNATELTSVIAKTNEGRPSFAISVIVSSILQIALFAIPLLAILGWIIHQPMTLSFEVFMTTLLFLAVLAVNRLLKDGVYTYLHGVMLIQL